MLSVVSRNYAIELGLPDSGQDWGVEHSDPARLEEFVKFSARYKPRGAWDMEDLADLVFQSAEEVLEQGVIQKNARRELIHFVQSRRHEFPYAIKHWTTGPDHFLVAEILMEATNAT